MVINRHALQIRLAVVVTGLLLTTSLARSLGTENQQPAQLGSAGLVAAPVNHTFGAFWTVGNGRNATLLLRNLDRQNPALAKITIYSHTGTAISGAQVQLQANGVFHIALSDLVTPQPGTAEWGGLAVEFAVASQVQGEIVNESANGARVHIALQGGLRFDTEHALSASWWMPDAATSTTLSLFNSSDQSISVSPLIVAAGARSAHETISLSPHETRIFAIKDLIVEGNPTMGSVVVNYTGPAHGLQPALTLENPGTGFLIAPAFNARHSQTSSQQTLWLFPEVSLLTAEADPSQSAAGTKTRPFVVLSNNSQSALSPQLIAFFGEAAGRKSKETDLPIAPLQAGETRLLDLSQFITMDLIPGDASHVALGIAHSGAPGDLGITVFTTNESGGMVVKAPGTIIPSGVAEAGFWNTNPSIGMLRKLNNATPGDSSVRETVYFATPAGVGSYTSFIDMPAGSEKLINVRDVLRSDIPDVNGNLVPAGTTSGLVVLTPEPPNRSSGAPSQLSAECLSACAPAAVSPSSMPSSSLTASLHFVSQQTSNSLAAVCAPPPSCPTSIRVAAQTPITLNDPGAFPTYKTGLGTVATINVGSVVEQWDGTAITESVTPGGTDTCPRKYLDACGTGTGHDTFTVGEGSGTVFGKSFPAAHNSFYDFHLVGRPYSLLDTAKIKGCTQVCSQSYSCGGNVIGNFTITKVFRKGTISGTPVTNVTVTVK